MFNKSMIALCSLLFTVTPVSNLSHAEELTGLELIHTQGCKGCHTINDVGGVSGPSLDGVGNRLPREQIRQKLLKGDNNQHDLGMPSSNHLTEHEIDLLTDYMTDLR